MPDKRPRRRLRATLLVVGALILLPIAVSAVVLATFDPNHYKPQIAAAAKRATGRDLALNGKLRLSVGSLSLEAQDVSFANVPGGSRPNMATLQGLQAQLAFWPLLHRRLEITRLVLIHPDILLETDAAGHPNWRLRRPGQPAEVPGPPRARTVSTRFDVHAVRIENGTVTWHDGRTGRTQIIGVPRLEVTETSETAPIALAAQLAWRGTAVAVNGRVGSQARLRDRAATTPWPVQMTIGAGGAQLTVSGSFTQPAKGRGYTLKLDGTVPDLARLAPLAPKAKLPPLRDVAFSVQLADSGGKRPDISSLVVHAGASDLGSVTPGLRLTRLDVAAPRLDQPVHVAMAGSYADAPLELTATLGAPAALLPGVSKAPFPVDVAATAAGAHFTAKGGIASPDRLSGLDLKLTARIPDLAALSPLLHRRLPPLKTIAFDGELTDRAGSYVNGIALKGLALSLPQADLAGEAVLGLVPRPSLQATLTSGHIDLDALSGALAVPAPAPTPPAAGAAAPPPAPVPASPARPTAGRLIPDTPLPLDRLRLVDADVQLAVAVLRSGGLEYRDLAGHLVLRDGHLRLDPLDGHVPGGRLDLRLDIDAAQPAPPIALVLHAPAIALKPLIGALHLPDDDAGNLEVDADLHGIGDSPRALAAGLDGHLGLALVDGAVDNRLLAATLGDVLRAAKLPATIGNEGHSDVRCFALRLDFTHGIGAVRAFMLDMSRFRVTGAGAINLSDEALALRLRPMVKLGGSGVVVPVRVQGTVLKPRAQVEPAGAASSAAGLAAALGVPGSAAGALAGALTGEQLLGATESGNCGPALALARGGRPGPAAPPPKPEKGPSARGLLRSLFR